MKTLENNKVCVTSLKILGDFWTLQIIDALKDGELRYCEIQRAVEGVNTVTLTTRLKKLELSGIITRNEQSRADVIYALTPVGSKTLPILDAVNSFSSELKKLQKA